MEITIKAPDGYTVRITVTDTPPSSDTVTKRNYAINAYEWAKEIIERPVSITDLAKMVAKQGEQN